MGSSGVCLCQDSSSRYLTCSCLSNSPCFTFSSKSIANSEFQESCSMLKVHCSSFPARKSEKQLSLEVQTSEAHDMLDCISRQETSAKCTMFNKIHFYTACSHPKPFQSLKIFYQDMSATKALYKPKKSMPRHRCVQGRTLGSC